MTYLPLLALTALATVAAGPRYNLTIFRTNGEKTVISVDDIDRIEFTEADSGEQPDPDQPGSTDPNFNNIARGTKLQPDLTASEFAVAFTRRTLEALQEGPIQVCTRSHALACSGIDYTVDTQGNPVMTRIYSGQRSRGCQREKRLQHGNSTLQGRRRSVDIACLGLQRRLRPGDPHHPHIRHPFSEIHEL